MTATPTKFKRGDLAMYLNPEYPGLMCFDPVKIRKVKRGVAGIGDFYEIQFTKGKKRFTFTHATERQLFTPEEQKAMESSPEESSAD